MMSYGNAHLIIRCLVLLVFVSYRNERAITESLFMEKDDGHVGKQAIMGSALVSFFLASMQFQ